jgi:hypothetical protein
MVGSGVRLCPLGGRKCLRIARIAGDCLSLTKTRENDLMYAESTRSCREDRRRRRNGAPIGTLRPLRRTAVPSGSSVAALLAA